MYFYNGCNALPKKTLKIATENSNDVLVQVKANQKQLLENCEDTERFTKPKEIYKSDMIKTHGRIEQRTVRVFTSLDFIQDIEWKKYIKSIIIVDRHREPFNTTLKKWEISHEKSYYIFTSVLPAVQLHDKIKDHWLIENSNNYVRDVSLKEDENKSKAGANILARIRSFALNILRQNKVKSIKETLYINSLSIDLLMKYKI